MKKATLATLAGLVGGTATITSLYMTTHKLNEMLDEDPNPGSSRNIIKAGILGVGAGAISGAIGSVVTDCVFVSFSNFVK